MKGKDHSLKSKRAVSTRLQSRTAMFLPVKQLSKNFSSTDIEVTNRYGKITLRDCKLTQVHRNIIDVIFSNYEAIKLDDGSVAFTFSKYDVLKELGYSYRNNTNWLESKFEEIRRVSIVLLSDDEELSVTCYQGVIREHAETVIKSKKNQMLYGVIFLSNFMKMFDVDMNIHSAIVTPKILKLQHAVTQALVRTCISHRSPNHDLDELLVSIGVNRDSVTSRAYSKNLKSVLDEKDALRELFGIEIKTMKNQKMSVFYKQHEDVRFTNTNPSKQQADDEDHSDDQQK